MKTKIYRHQLLLLFSIPKSFYLDTVNDLQNVPFQLNYQLIEFVYFKKLQISSSIGNLKKLNDEYDIVLKSKKELINKLKKKHCLNKENINIFFKTFYKTEEGEVYLQTLLEYDGKKELIMEKKAELELLDKIFISKMQLNKYLYVNKVYMPLNIDFRGRLYPLVTDFNFHASKYSRYLFKFSEKTIFNLTAFKIYCVRVFFKPKYNDEECLKLFDDKLDQYLKEFRFNMKYILLANNLMAFISCCIEYESFLLFKSINFNEDYYSNFMVTLDATASGSQILCCLLRDNEFVEALNLKDLKKEDKSMIGDYYVTFVELLMNNYLDVKGRALWEKSLLKQLDFIELRKFFKNILMTLNYGLTFIGFGDKFDVEYRKLVVEKKKKTLIKIAELHELKISLWKAFQKIKLLNVHILLKKLIPLIHALNIDIDWTIPNIARIKQKYYKEYSVQLDLRLYKAKRDKVKFKLETIAINKKDLTKTNVVKNQNSITANFIHSLDSSILIHVAHDFFMLKKPIACVHDCFLVRTSDIDFVVKSYQKAFEVLLLQNDLLSNLFLNYAHLIKHAYLQKDKENKKLFKEINDMIQIINNFDMELSTKDYMLFNENLKNSKYTLLLG